MKTEDIEKLKEKCERRIYMLAEQTVLLIMPVIRKELSLQKEQIIKKLIEWHKSQEGYYDECDKKKGAPCDFCNFINELKYK